MNSSLAPSTNRIHVRDQEEPSAQNLKIIQLNDVSRTILQEDSQNNSKDNFDGNFTADASKVRFESGKQSTDFRPMIQDKSVVQYEKGYQNMTFSINSPIRSSKKGSKPLHFNFGQALPSERSDQFLKYNYHGSQYNRFDGQQQLGKRQVDLTFNDDFARRKGGKKFIK